MPRSSRGGRSRSEPHDGRIELSLDVGGSALLGEPVKPFLILRVRFTSLHQSRQKSLNRFGANAV
jgi:hypothetical protein